MFDVLSHRGNTQHCSMYVHLCPIFSESHTSDISFAFKEYFPFLIGWHLNFSRDWAFLFFRVRSLPNILFFGVHITKIILFIFKKFCAEFWLITALLFLVDVVGTLCFSPLSNRGDFNGGNRTSSLQISRLKTISHHFIAFRARINMKWENGREKHSSSNI